MHRYSHMGHISSRSVGALFCFIPHTTSGIAGASTTWAIGLALMSITNEFIFRNVWYNVNETINHSFINQESKTKIFLYLRD